ncbi:hypothetical protein HHK36_007516 [Tetracentron sinense]|uniref:TPX2 C-terminal domain-containing protein n=1 Tax=Tetracentron sinense TaxID=13715 RepID=A0A834ZTN6_TETSI|nr:hypothetical protein HHK36_007516 [Tetracentron sinense]
MFVSQGNPIHALGESISFGRFVSESLAWEKWSSFSHNRYLEEVEKYSKPGSVAQKKAYFESHYKRIAAKKAAALLEEANAAADNAPEPEIEDAIHNATGQDSEWEGSNSHVVTPDTEAIFVINANGYNSNAEMVELKIAKVDGADPFIENQVLVENPMQFESSNQLRDVENHNNDTETELSRTNLTEKPTLKESFTAYEKALGSTSKMKPAVSSSKSSVYSRASKLLPYSVKPTTPVRPRMESNATPNSKKSARDSVDKMRSTPKSLHMSINFAHPTGETNKLTSPILRKIGNSRVAASSSKASKDCLTPMKTPTRASVNGIPKHPSVTPQTENRRTKTPVDKSVSGSRTGGPKWHSFSMDRSKSLGACGNKACFPTVSSPFSFRSDERAAKRKEARPDPKLEDKFNAKETQKLQLQTKAKEKAETQLRNLRQSLGFKAKPMPDFNREIESSKNQIKKIPLTRPRSPKLGRKSSPSKVQYTSPLPPRRPSVKSDGSKHVMKKNNQIPARNLTSLPNKNTHENASPNIHH